MAHVQYMNWSRSENCEISYLSTVLCAEKSPRSLGVFILVQYSDKNMYSFVLYSIVLRRSQLYNDCIVNLLLCGYNTIQSYAYIHRSIGQSSVCSDIKLKVQKYHFKKPASIFRV